MSLNIHVISLIFAQTNSQPGCITASKTTGAGLGYEYPVTGEALKTPAQSSRVTSLVS